MALTEEQLESTSGFDQLLARARTGDEDAFCQLAQSCEQRLFQQALALSRSQTSAEDLVAETLFEAWKSLPRFNGACRFTTWLYAILVHRFHKTVRHTRSRPIPLASLSADQASERVGLLEQLPDSRPLPSDALVQAEFAGQLTAAIGMLPAKHQAVVLLRFYEGASVPEIAVALDISTGTVKSRLFYALERLRRTNSVMNLLNSSGDT